MVQQQRRRQIKDSRVYKANVLAGWLHKAEENHFTDRVEVQDAGRGLASVTARICSCKWRVIYRQSTINYMPNEGLIKATLAVS